jgi:hypothetical protein
MPFDVRITALDGTGAVETGYTGPQCLTFSGPDDAPDGAAPAYPAQHNCTAGSAVNFTAGLATVSVTLVDPETTTLRVTDNSSGIFGVSGSISVTAPGNPSTTTTGTTTATPVTTTSVPIMASSTTASQGKATTTPATTPTDTWALPGQARVGTTPRG